MIAKLFMPKAIAFVTALILFPVAANAMTGQSEPGDHTSIDQAAITETDKQLLSFIDGLLTANMEQHNMAGAAVSVVQGDALMVLKGYGYADIAQQLPVNPSRHMFRIGSITKTFTFTLLMQLVEEGRISLDADVNDYLSEFKIPPAFGRPVLVRDLLTHRPGFEEAYRDLFVDSPEKFHTLDKWLADNIPARVFPPGETTSYSNYGAALAGYIVQEVTGKLYEDQLEQKILDPLGMSLTTARQLLPSGGPQAMPEVQAANVASVYASGAGYLEPADFELIVGAPAGSISSTAADMARYMSAHLGYGKLGTTQILRPQTARTMQERPYPGRPSADYAHGFRTENLLGYDTFEHGGATGTSFSSMIMVPELGIGVFITTNGANLATAPQIMARQIVKHIIGDRSKGNPGFIAFSAADAEPYVGSYMTTRRGYSGLIKILSAFAGAGNVSLSPNNGLIINAGGPDEYFPIGNNAFRSRKSGEVVSFTLSEDGNATQYTVGYGHTTMHRTPSDTNPLALYSALALAAILSILQFASAWRQRSEEKPSNPWTLKLSRLTLFSAVSMTAVLLALFFVVVEMSALGRNVIFAWPMSSLSLLSVLVIIQLLFTLALLVGLVPAFTRSDLNTWRKAHYVLLALVFANLMIQFHNWNLIGFNYW